MPLIEFHSHLSTYLCFKMSMFFKSPSLSRDFIEEHKTTFIQSINQDSANQLKIQ